MSHMDPSLVQTEASLLYNFQRAILSLDKAEASRIIGEASANSSPISVIERIIAPALEQLGKSWEDGVAALSQVYMGGRLCEEIVSSLMPELHPGVMPATPIAMATLEDYHLLGKRIVLTALRASGIAVRDYGRCTVEEVAERVQADGIEILLLSTLMLPSALRVKEARAALSRQGARTRIVVGGAPFRLEPGLATEVGADAVGMNAADAISIVRGLRTRVA